MKQALLALALTAASLGANAGIVGFANEFSGGVKCANLVTGCAELETTAIAGGVHFVLQGTMTGTEFITGLYGNIGPYSGVTVANLTGATNTIGGGFSFAPDTFKADGDGFFDWNLDLSSNPPRFSGTDTLSWDFLGITLAQTNDISVNGPVGKTGFQYAIHAQGLVNGGSGWDSQTGCPDCSITPVIAVPEPGTVSLMVAGLAALGISRRRRQDK
jgi:hypothetical protein